MPQNPLAGTVTSGSMAVGNGISSKLNVSATGVIKAGSGRLVRVNVVTAGTTTVTTFNDAATTGAAAAGNVIHTIPAANMTAGASILLDWPCANGIVISALSTSAVLAISYT